MADRSRLALWGAAAITLIGVIAAARVEDAPEAPARSARRAAAPQRTADVAAPALLPVPAAPMASVPQVIAFERLRRPRFDAGEAARIAQAWEPPPPPPPARPAALQKPPPPQAPPLPFRVIGSFSDGAAAAAIVQSGQRTLVLRSGDVVDGKYRVEQVTDKEVTLMYLPLNILQTLALGSPQ